jgi:acetyl esterase/lipase
LIERGRNNFFEESGMTIHPSTDPELASMLRRVPDSPIDWNNIAARRATKQQIAEALSLMPINPSILVEDHWIHDSRTGTDIGIRVYRPNKVLESRPGIYVIHGGGMVLGGLVSEELNCRHWVEDLGCVVVSVDYRLAPETQYPGPLEDCYKGLQWMTENARLVGIDSSRIGLYGTSAGGGLAAAVALMARDCGDPSVIFMLLNAPMLDNRLITPSTQQFADAPIWSRNDNLHGWQAYLGSLEESGALNSYAVPARAVRLDHLPSTFISVGSVEIFRDEDVDFATRLMEAGVSVELQVWPGVFHGAEQFADAAIVKRIRAKHTAVMKHALYG